MPLATVKADNGFVPQDAIRAGTDTDGTRCTSAPPSTRTERILGNPFEFRRLQHFSYAGVEHTVSNYYVLVPDWLGSSKFDFPAGSDTEGKSAKCLPGVSQWRIYIPRQNAVNLESLQLRVEREGRMGQLV